MRTLVLEDADYTLILSMLNDYHDLNAEWYDDEDQTNWEAEEAMMTRIFGPPIVVEL